MDRGPAKGVLRELRALFVSGSLGGLTDAELLERFVASSGDGGHDAFSALVQRHGPTVLGVCERMLSVSHDVEDAFQATFLVLRGVPRRSAGASNWETGFMVLRSGPPRKLGAGGRALARWKLG